MKVVLLQDEPKVSYSPTLILSWRVRSPSWSPDRENSVERSLEYEYAVPPEAYLMLFG